MPEAAVNKDGQALVANYKVWMSGQIEVPAKTNSRTSENACEINLWLCSSRTDGGHVAAAFCGDISIRHSL